MKKYILMSLVLLFLFSCEYALEEDLETFEVLGAPEEMLSGETIVLSIESYPEVEIYDLEWDIEDDQVAYVNDDGTLIGIAEGSTKVTVIDPLYDREISFPLEVRRFLEE